MQLENNVGEKFKYHAFISYRHADNKEEGRHWATWLHQALENYEIPEELVGKKNARGDVIPDRIFPIFRDEDELPADADLAGAITRALDGTNFLVVLCSPRAVQSKYVADEIDYFKKLGRSDRVMAAMIDGEPNASWDEGKLSSGHKVDDECFPVPIQFQYQDGLRTEERAEPIAADFRIVVDGRSQQGWTNAAHYKAFLQNNTSLHKKEIEKQTKRYDQQLKLMVLKVVAGIIGVSLGELTQRDKEYQLKQEKERSKKLQRWLVLVACLSLIAIVTGIFAYNKKLQADESSALAQLKSDEVQISQSKFLLNKAKEEQSAGQTNRALLLALNALPGIRGGNRPLVEEVYDNLYELQVSQIQHTVLEHNDLVRGVGFSANGQKLVTASKDGYAKVWNAQNGQVEASFFHNEEVYRAYFVDDYKLITLSKSGVISLWSISTGEREKSIATGDRFFDFALDKHTKQFVTLTFNGRGETALWDIQSGEKLKSFAQQLSQGEKVEFADFSADSGLIAIGTSSGRFQLVNLSGDVMYERTYPGPIASLAFIQKGKEVMVAAENSVFIQSYPDVGSSQKIQFNSEIEAAFTDDHGRFIFVREKRSELIKEFDRLYEEYSDEFIMEGDFLSFGVDATGSYVIGSANGDIRIKSQGNVLNFKGLGEVFDSQLSEDKKFAVTSLGNKAVVWQLNHANSPSTFHELDAPIREVVLSPNKELALIRTVNAVYLWSRSSDTLDKIVGNYVDVIRFSDDGKKVVFVVRDDEQQITEVSMRDTTDFSVVNTRSVEHLIYHLTPFENNAYFVTKDDKQLTLNSLFEDKTVGNVSISGSAYDVRFMGQGLKVIYNDDGGIWLWEPRSQKRLKLADNGKAILSDASNIVALIDEGLVNFLNTETLTQVSSLYLSNLNSNVHVSPTGRFAVTDEGILFDITKGEKIKLLEEFYLGVQAISFSDDELQMAIADWRHSYSFATTSGVLLSQYQNHFKDDVYYIKEGTEILGANYKYIFEIPNIVAADYQMKARQRLALGKTCLSPQEREQFYLSKLTDAQWLARGCQQHSLVYKEKAVSALRANLVAEIIANKLSVLGQKDGLDQSISDIQQAFLQGTITEQQFTPLLNSIDVDFKNEQRQKVLGTPLFQNISEAESLALKRLFESQNEIVQEVEIGKKKYTSLMKRYQQMSSDNHPDIDGFKQYILNETDRIKRNFETLLNNYDLYIDKYTDSEVNKHYK